MYLELPDFFLGSLQANKPDLHEASPREAEFLLSVLSGKTIPSSSAEVVASRMAELHV